MSTWRWADWIEPVPPAARITLGEGNTPLIPSKKIGPQAGLRNLSFKLETANPTGSFKDRFAAVAISHMVAGGRYLCVATSSGNTGSALAAYCAAAGVTCRIAVVETAPERKLRQMMACGAEIFRVRGFGLDPNITGRTFESLRRIGRQPGAAIQISAYVYSPAGMSGVQTISHELVEQSAEPIDHVFCPAGGGGLTLAVARGFAQMVERGRLPASPAIECVQPEGNNTISGPLRDGAERAREVDCTTEISGLQVPNVNDGHLVIEECRPTGGTGHLVTDADVWELQKRLAREEGIFCEPAGAVALAGALQAASEEIIDPDARIVCLVTGSGFKDEASVDRMVQSAICPTVDLSTLELQAADPDRSDFPSGGIHDQRN